VLRVTAGEWALGGERSLWTGRAARGRITPGEAGLALYLVAALVVLAVLASHWLRQLPAIVEVLVAIAWGVGALQSIWMLVTLLVIGPARLRRTVYEVTNYRVIVSGGRGRGDVTSAYLDQIGAPTVRPHPGGTGDVRLRTGGGRTQGSLLTGLFQSGGFGPSVVSPVTVLREVPDAEQACQVIAEAQRRMRDAVADAPPPQGRFVDPAVPAEIALGRGEDVLWTGGPGRIPWWFSWSDLYLTVFALLWLAFVAGMGVFVARSGSPLFLIWLGLMALAGGVYPAAGRVVHRRLRIKRSRYVLTNRRLITALRPLRGGGPVLVQAPLGALLPPALRGPLLMTGLASPDSSSRRTGWKGLTWPATTVTPPVFIGLANAHEVATLIGSAQIATRALVTG
jgi:hypothetical protein